MKHLVLAFDGTWNTPDSTPSDGDESTNVWHLARALATEDAQGHPQNLFYCAGVGTDFHDRIRGGVFGQGLTDRMLSGYRYLVQHYRPGDRVYLIGFSRGAFTARSLAGMIEGVGLVKNPAQINAAFKAYQFSTDSDSTQFRNRLGRLIPIEALALWDTVGTLGIPLPLFAPYNRYRYQFHNTRLSHRVRHAFHALAIDEHRFSFKPTRMDKPPLSQTRVEQRWFPGAHADVGGGYLDRRLAEISYRWMQGRLSALGLVFADAPKPAHRLPLPHDSFSSFAAGLYARFGTRYLRPLGLAEHGEETVDPSVFQLMQQHPGYRPANPISPSLDWGEQGGTLAERFNNLSCPQLA